MLSKPISELVDQFSKLPGVGPKSAQRLTYYLLRQPKEEVDSLIYSLNRLKTDLVTCETCFNITEHNPCVICEDSERDTISLCVVEEPLDLIAIEKTKKHTGQYHVLGGVINPLMGIGPEEIRMYELFNRVKIMISNNLSEEIEIIIATNPSVEGEATAMFIKRFFDSHEEYTGRISVTRIARGLPTGGDVEYADQITLGRALEGRSSF